MTTYPKAEKIAETMNLPMMAEPEAKNLYGTIDLILDEAAATRELNRHGIFCTTPAYRAAIDILLARIESVG